MMQPSASISKGEKQLLQIVSAIANADGELSLGEADFMVEEQSISSSDHPLC
jgi:hypothetical protein